MPCSRSAPDHAKREPQNVAEPARETYEQSKPGERIQCIERRVGIAIREAVIEQIARHDQERAQV